MEEIAREDNATGRGAGKPKRMHVCRLSERIKTERIANGFPFQSVNRGGSADPFTLFPDDGRIFPNTSALNFRMSYNLFPRN